MNITKNDKIIKSAFIFSAVLFVLSVGAKFYLCNSITVKNGHLEQAFLQKDDIEEDIEMLEVQLASLSSIEYLESRAKDLGFVEMNKNLISIDLDAPNQVALVTSR